MLSKEPLRFRDEFVRHKILDIIGDLILSGRRLRGHVVAIKPWAWTEHGGGRSALAKRYSNTWRWRLARFPAAEACSISMKSCASCRIATPS